MQSDPDFDAWRLQARRFLAAGRQPEDVHWDHPAQESLLDARDAVAPTDHGVTTDEAGGRAQDTRFNVPSRLLDLLAACACHRDPQRYALMYRLLWRTVHENQNLLDDAADDDVQRVARMAKAVSRDCHKMKAFVRFRELAAASGASRFVAWFEPEHHILRRVAPFFAQRFGSMLWTIVTPDGAAHWDRATLQYLPFDPALVLPADDAKEELWLTYYESIFNPARLNVRAMQKEMPQKYWPNLPEAARIPALIAGASRRAGKMVETVSLRDVMPRKPVVMKSLDASDTSPPDKAHIDGCRRCGLWERATQGVSGEGPATARLMLVGEQPGDEEDLQGKPFVGPAGKLLRRLIDEAGIAPGDFFVTNAVKHFSWEPRGKRRIHKTPAQREIIACRAWLDAEITRVKPAVIVALGASALNAVTGQRLKVGEARAAKLAHATGAMILATYHPSAALRAPDEDARAVLTETLVADLARAAKLAKIGKASRG